MTVESVPELPARDEKGLWQPSCASPNPGGTNQYSPEVVNRRALAKAITRKLAAKPKNGKPHCLEALADKVEDALRDPDDHIPLLNFAFPVKASSNADLGSDRDGREVEVDSRRQWDSLAVEFSSHFTPDTELVIEQSNPSEVEGTT